MFVCPGFALMANESPPSVKGTLPVTSTIPHPGVPGVWQLRCSLHTLATHAPRARHGRPQPPQFAASVCVSTHAVPQRVRPDGQSHTPPAHVWSVRHARLHPPQFAASELRSTQFVPQTVCPLGHDCTHDPPAHITEPPDGATHPRLHAPQWLVSVAVSRQVPPQLVSPEHVPPGGHAGAPAEPHVTHAPLLQKRPVPHAPPQRPQCALSPRRSTSQPLSGFVSQSPAFALHAPTRHRPPTHAAVARGSEHTTPHPPQWEGLVCVSTHAPAQRMVAIGQTEP
jgi:hypothetical protein